MKPVFIMKLLSLILLAGTAVAGSQNWNNTCIIPALNNGDDDSPAIRQAFQDCGKNGNIVFQENTTYNIQTTLQLHNLSNVQVDLRGTLLFSTDVHYWIRHGNLGNTDGFDTINTDNVTILNSFADMGDDCISFKPGKHQGC
ncbi:hypothetical protein SLS53_006985 [Cytospora paraplurivora]|uniref:Uncharacterized protein n=1 Tax=Cytospora paraplurivora TaxID=2898453 RepID=A0AAN9U1M0_9PEZI